MVPEVGVLQQVQAPQQGGLAGAGGADDGHHLALVDVQIAVIQGLDRAVIVLLVISCRTEMRPYCLSPRRILLSMASMPLEAG